ncbi:DUF190 domain-containing protein [Caldinitratiruptor microaerophilus]|uniref:DUF190 domain-containing protein n=1 Tax=Caldinitratiruptor microaerophilus TaxID=671077 RepID=A0AA35CR11_9FIRM|nr:DUF190 domain-containing protein [Caldinitratiruptor microaerophilus]BDG62366.1 hypothetical protein caldi_34560 [Caldinitratiruptor microaerophilus]
MKVETQGVLLRMFIGESDQYRGMPLYHAIVLKIRELGMSGATVLRGVEGFGAHSRIHTANILRLSQDLPIVIEVIDTEERIRRLVEYLDRMVPEGLLMTVEGVRIIRYARTPGEGKGTPGQEKG